MRSLEEIYRDVCSWEFITPKQMANLICGNDPSGKGLKQEPGTKFYSTLQLIKDAKNRGDIKCVGDSKNNSNLNRKVVFEWAADQKKNKPWTKKTHGLRLLYERNVGNASCSLSSVNIGTVTGFAYSTPCDLVELKQAYGEAMGKIHKLQNEHKQEIQELTAEIERLSVFEQDAIEQHKKRQTNGRKGGLASNGKDKNY